MKLLLDQNLSRHLVGHLRKVFPGSEHVSAVGLQDATGDEIWEYAGEHDLGIVSKDSDFRQLSFLHGPPPKGRLASGRERLDGNGAAGVIDHAQDSGAFGRSEDEALLVLPNRRST